MSDYGPLKLVPGNSNPALVESVAKHLELGAFPTTVGRFHDQEVRVLAKEGEDGDVRECDVFILQSTNPPAEHLIELFLLINALRGSSTARVTAVIPYFGYACQDRKARPREPQSAKVMAKLISSLLGDRDRVMLFDLHAPQIQGFFDLDTVDHLYLRVPILADIRAHQDLTACIMVAPDVGAANPCRSYAKRLGLGLAICDKNHDPQSGEITIEGIDNPALVEGKRAIFWDDMIRGSTTARAAADIVLGCGAVEAVYYASHPVLAEGACEALAASSITEVVVTDSVFISDEKKQALGRKLRVIPIGGFIADAIRRTHDGRSVSALFEERPGQPC